MVTAQAANEPHFARLTSSEKQVIALALSAALPRGAPFTTEQAADAFAERVPEWPRALLAYRVRLALWRLHLEPNAPLERHGHYWIRMR